MENKDLFKNAGEPWYQNEDDQLNDLYNDKMLTILEISKIHNRAPGGIISRLLRNNYIPNRVSARGYLEYKNSDLYKQIVSRNIENMKYSKMNEKNSKNVKIFSVDNMLITIDKSDYQGMKNDIHELKKEIVDLKRLIHNFIEMFKENYQFGDA